MKRLFILALLAGCGSSPSIPLPEPVPEAVREITITENLVTWPQTAFAVKYDVTATDGDGTRLFTVETSNLFVNVPETTAVVTVCTQNRQGKGKCKERPRPEEPPIEEPPEEEPPEEEPPEEPPIEEPSCEDEEGGCVVGSFSEVTAGQPIPWPAEAAEAMTLPYGTLSLQLTADLITTSGQRILHGDNFGIWLWQNQIHGDFWTADGTRMLWRDPDSAVVPGEARRVNVVWSPSHYVVFIDGNIHVHYQGETAPRGANLVYGGAATTAVGFVGKIDVTIWDDIYDYEVCENLDNWATINNRAADIPESCLTDVTLNWTPPTGCVGDIPFGQTVDNQKCGVLAGYKVYSEEKVLKEVPSADTTTVLTQRLPGKCYTMTSFILAAENKILESVPSNESCK